MATPRSLDQQIGELCNAAIRDHVFPGCQVGYARSGETQVLPFGRLTYDADAPDVTGLTVYDVASITKSVPTSSIILKLVEEGRLSLDDKAITFLPELANEYREEILIRHLLLFTVVFKLPDTMAEAARTSPDQLLEMIFSAPVTAPPGQKYTYTNAPSLLLGLIAERICQQPLDEIAQVMFFAPLGMSRTTFHAEPLPLGDVAPTALDWRGEVRGRVHDPGAWALFEAGRIPGHAGLFSTAADLLRFAAMLTSEGQLEGQRFFSSKTVRAMHTNQLQGLNEAAGLGWMMSRPETMGTAGSPEVFGRTGFTGTMFLIDPVKKRALVVLSNRTYPRVPESYDAIRSVWRSLADLVLEG